MKFHTNVKIVIAAIIQLMLISCLNSMIPKSEFLQQQALNQLIIRSNLGSIIQKISDSQPPCIDFSSEITDFILRNNFALCRMLILTKIAQTQQWVSETSNNEMQITQANIAQKTSKKLCKYHKLFTACTDGMLSCLDLRTQKKQSINAQNGAFSCINAKSGILITSEINSHTINFWNISDLTPCSKITTDIPTAYVEVIDYLFIVLNTAGNVDFYIWPSGQKLCTIETRIPGIIYNVSWNNAAKKMFVTTTEGIYIISLGDMIIADQLLHNLTLSQIILVAYLLQNETEIILDTPELDAIFNSLPTMLQTLIKLRK